MTALWTFIHTLSISYFLENFSLNFRKEKKLWTALKSEKLMCYELINIEMLTSLFYKKVNCDIKIPFYQKMHLFLNI